MLQALDYLWHVVVVPVSLHNEQLLWVYYQTSPRVYNQQSWQPSSTRKCNAERHRERERERWAASKLASSWKRQISFYCKHIELAAAELQTMSLLLLAETLSLLDTHKKTQLHKEIPLVISDESS
jgi:hypothetical protein